MEFDIFKECPSCGSRAIQIGLCGHGYCYSCEAAWSLHNGKLIEDKKEGG